MEGADFNATGDECVGFRFLCVLGTARPDASKPRFCDPVLLLGNSEGCVSITPLHPVLPTHDELLSPPRLFCVRHRPPFQSAPSAQSAPSGGLISGRNLPGYWARRRGAVMTWERCEAGRSGRSALGSSACRANESCAAANGGAQWLGPGVGGAQ